MILVQLSEHNFEYDVHSLVKAFYPEEDVHVTCIETPEEETESSLRLVISFVKGKKGRDAEAAADAAQKEKEEEQIEKSAGRETTAGASQIDRDRTEDTQGSEEGPQICARLQEPGGPTLSETAVLPEGTDRRETKNELKRLLYRLLSGATGRQLPWGNLTGIRPTKIPMSLLVRGRTEEEITRYMQETYYTSREKTALAIEIARRERQILQGLPVRNAYSLYVGIPFCPSICLYCSFSSSPISLWRDKVDQYLDALCREIDYASGIFAGKELTAVYIGGGTPTTLEPYQLERLLTQLETRFPMKKVREFTVEAGRPDSVTREKLEVLRAHGISRISINPQTMNQATLDLIGRRHTVEQTIQAFSLAREMGFDNINMDLIVGLPGEDKEEVEHTLQEVLKLDPENLTVHSLAVKRAARLRLFKQEHREMTIINNAQIMDMTAGYASRAGLHPYYLYRQKNMAGNFENVGYAKEGKAGIYNILIMEEVQSILALGAGASTKMVYADNRIERIENVKDIKTYMERIDEMIERKRAGIHE